jgi:hypothetical protein
VVPHACLAHLPSLDRFTHHLKTHRQRSLKVHAVRRSPSRKLCLIEREWSKKIGAINEHDDLPVPFTFGEPDARRAFHDTQVKRTTRRCILEKVHGLSVAVPRWFWQPPPMRDASKYIEHRFDCTKRLFNTLVGHNQLKINI